MGSLAKDSRSLVIDLINTDNKTAFAYDELVLSPPSPNNIVTYNRNSAISVTSSDAFQYEGAETLYYNRLDFSMLFAGLTITLGGAGFTNIASLLPELNSTFGLGLTMDDLVAQAIPSNATYPYAMTLTALGTSYAFIGSFPIIVQNIAPQIGNNLVNTVLSNIGATPVTLQTAIDDLNSLASSIIHMNLDRYRRDNYLRALSQDVMNDAMVAIQQALDISGFDDADRAMAADIKALQNTIAGLDLSVPQVTLDQINANTAAIATNQTTLNGLTSSLSANTTQLGTNTTAITTLQTNQSTLTTGQATLVSGLTSTNAILTTAVGNISTLSAAVTALQNAPPPTSAPAYRPILNNVTLSTSSGMVQGSTIMSEVSMLTKIVTSAPLRLRLYPTAGERDADLNRAIGTPATAGNSVLFESVTTADLLAFNTGPTPMLYNGDEPATNNIYYTLEPTGSGAASATLSYYGFV